MIFPTLYNFTSAVLLIPPEFLARIPSVTFYWGDERSFTEVNDNTRYQLQKFAELRDFFAKANVDFVLLLPIGLRKHFSRDEVGNELYQGTNSTFFPWEGKHNE